MGFVRQSYRMQMFVAFLIATLSLVIFGGILTVQGFQANVKAAYEKRDAEQELLVNERISSMLDSVEETFDRIAQNEILCNSFSKGRKNSIEIYAALYDESQNVRSFGVVELYIGSVCMYSTKVGYKSETLPEYYSILHAASNSGGKTVYSLDPQNISGNEPDLLIAREIVNKDYPGYAIIRIEQETLREQLSGALNARDGYMLVNNLFQSLCLMGTAEDEKSLNLIRSNLFDGKLYNDGFESNIYMTEIGDTGLLSIYITPPAMDASAVRAGYQIIIILAIISVIVCLIVANQLSNYVAKPIGTLAAGMRKFRKGDFDAKIELDREDEFEQLAVGFNKMTTQLKETMEERVTAERRVNETRIFIILWILSSGLPRQTRYLR